MSAIAFFLFLSVLLQEGIHRVKICDGESMQALKVMILKYG